MKILNKIFFSGILFFISLVHAAGGSTGLEGDAKANPNGGAVASVPASAALVSSKPDVGKTMFNTRRAESYGFTFENKLFKNSTMTVALENGQSSDQVNIKWLILADSIVPYYRPSDLIPLLSELIPVNPLHSIVLGYLSMPEFYMYSYFKGQYNKIYAVGYSEDNNTLHDIFRFDIFDLKIFEKPEEGEGVRGLINKWEDEQASAQCNARNLTKPTPEITRFGRKIILHMNRALISSEMISKH